MINLFQFKISFQIWSIMRQENEWWMLNYVACELWSEATRSSACAASEAPASDRENWSLNQGISHLFEFLYKL